MSKTPRRRIRKVEERLSKRGRFASYASMQERAGFEHLSPLKLCFTRQRLQPDYMCAQREFSMPTRSTKRRIAALEKKLGTVNGPVPRLIVRFTDEDGAPTNSASMGDRQWHREPSEESGAFEQRVLADLPENRGPALQAVVFFAGPCEAQLPTEEG
jgi:hypothetical protein